MGERTKNKKQVSRLQIADSELQISSSVVKRLHSKFSTFYILHSTFKRPTAPAYSLLELIVSMGIISLIIVIFSNALVLSFKVAYKTSGRSFIREEVSSVSLSMVRDIRNANDITSCAEDSCQFITDTKTVRWYLCGNSICREETTGTGTTQTFKTSNILRVTDFTFEEGFSTNTNTSERNILITIVGSHTNTELQINNVVRQTSVSTRNYEL